MIWPESDLSPVFLCERCPGKEHFGRASDVQSEIGLRRFGAGHKHFRLLWILLVVG